MKGRVLPRNTNIEKKFYIRLKGKNVYLNLDLTQKQHQMERKDEI